MTLLASSRHWARIGEARRAGVCVPLSSLRTSRGGGAGDLGDLPALVDWCAAVGASVIQLLPLNDLGLDSCPYSALSAFALDPLYLALDQVPEVVSDPRLLDRVRAEAARLSTAPRVDYAETRRSKLAILQEAFGRVDGHGLARRLDAYRADNAWLADYALFRAMKEAHGWRSWEDWGLGLDGTDARERARAERATHVRFHEWLQLLLDDQLQAAHAYAASRGVLLKGDVPILIGRDSADVWCQRRFFHLDRTAGAPPDMYAEDGQNWGFPTYDWDALAAEGHRWWRDRLALAGRWFDLYRIDHIVGFFRIWSIRHGERTGKNGWFDPPDEAAWGDHGRRILEMMLDATPMLPLGEDLGTIPHVCRDTMRSLGICGMKVQRWERRWEQDRGYIAPADYPELSLATLSTHDSETCAGWWEAPAYRADVQLLFETLGGTGAAPATLPDDLHEQLVRHVSGARSRFVVHLVHDLLAPVGWLPGRPSEHRVNVPGTVGPHNWSWRLPLSLDAMLADGPRVQRIRDMIRRV
jgi:4-alpha-glucanotransferase